MTAIPHTYDQIVDALESRADHSPVSDYCMSVALLRAQIAFANEMAACREILEGMAMSIDNIDGQFHRGLR